VTLFEPTPQAPEPAEHAQTCENEEEDGVEFRLFAAPAKDANGASQKIRYQSPKADDRPPGLVNPYRDRGYYFAAELSAEQRAQYASVVLSTQDVVALSKQPWPGAHLPWRVTRLSASGRVISALKSHASAPAAVNDEGRKRARPGKKARIAARKKLAAKRVKEELASQSRAEKEVADREKRTQRNREKKVKKKQRDKVKKIVVGAELDADHGDGVANT